MKNKEKQQGQVLLIVVLVATVLVTVGLSLSRLATEEQQVSKLEEESKKAFAGAEAGIEAALKQGDISDLSTLNLGGGITGSAIVQTSTATSFTTPIIKRDDIYSFYLSTYDSGQKKFTGTAYGGSMTINRLTPSGSYCSSSTTQFALELIFVNATTKAVSARRLIDECNLITSNTDETSFGTAINTAEFASHLLMIRVIAPDSTFSGTTLSIVNNGDNWPLQGKTIISTAKTGGGASRKLQLFQSYPQIPAEFFITSF